MLAGVLRNQALHLIRAFPALLLQHCNLGLELENEMYIWERVGSLLEGQELDFEFSGDVETVTVKESSTQGQLLCHKQTLKGVWCVYIKNPKQCHCLLHLPFAYTRLQLFKVRFQTTTCQISEVAGMNSYMLIAEETWKLQLPLRKML